VTILLSNGDGTFTAAASRATDMNPESVAVGDFDGDGNLDLAVANQTGNDVTILLGKGDGTFTAGSSVAITGPGAVCLFTPGEEPNTANGLGRRKGDWPNQFVMSCTGLHSKRPCNR